MKNKKIFITGGAGYLGKNLVKYYYDNNDITIYSRDESKHYFIKKQFPRINCVVGDIRNYDLLKRKSAGHDIGIFAASLKQIEAVNDNYEEANEIIVKGAINSRRVAEENGFESACFISSDKSRSATTIYGSMKFTAGELFINKPTTKTKLSTVIYGNVMNSTGSIIPLIWDSIENDYELTLYSPEMTRFMITIDDAIELIDKSLKYNGVNIIPNIKSFLIKDLFDIYADKFGLTYTIGKPRIMEKIHEIMIGREEVERSAYVPEDDLYTMSYNTLSDNHLPFSEYNSKDFVLTQQELNEFLSKNKFYKK